MSKLTPWGDVREELIRKAIKTRKSLSGIDDFTALRPVVQYNYVLDEAREYFITELNKMLDALTYSN